MSLEAWKPIDDTVLAKNPWWESRLAHYHFRGQTIDYYYMKTFDSVSVFVVNAHGKISMVRQYRALFDAFTLEVPMGGVEKGQTPREAAEHELAQEAQLKAGELHEIGWFNSNNGRIQARDYVFVGWDLSPAVEEVDAMEEFERLSMSPQEIDEAIARGEITCGMTLAGWQLARPKILEIIKQG